MDGKKVGHFFLGILPIVIGIGVQLILSFIGMVAYIMLHGVNLMDSLKNGTYMEAYMNLANQFINDWTVPLSFACAAVMLLICFFWYRYLSKYDEKISIIQALPVKRIAGIIILALGAQIAVGVILSIVQLILPDMFREFERLMEMVGGSQLTFLAFFYAVIFGPISEEFIFRGVCQKHFKKVVPEIYAIILQALLFGAYHMNIVQGLYAFLVGIVLGLIVEKTKSLSCGIVFHIAFNFSSYLISWCISEEMMASPIVNILYIVVGAIALVIGTKVFSSTIDEKENIETM